MSLRRNKKQTFETSNDVVRRTGAERNVRRSDTLFEAPDKLEQAWDNFLSGRHVHKPVATVRRRDGAPHIFRNRIVKPKERSTRGLRRPANVFHADFWRDRFLRGALLLCASVVLVSCIAIPTAFARPRTAITLNDGGRILSLETAAKTVGDCLKDNGIILAPKDILAQDSSAPITEGMEIKIWRAYEVTINSGDASTQVSMVSGTVSDALSSVGIYPEGLDEVYPSPDTLVRAGMQIEHVKVTKDETRHVYDIPYERVTREDPEMPEGETKVVQEGKPGSFEIVTEILYKNGVVYSQTVLSRTTLAKPVTEITAVGTYVEPPKTDVPSLNEIHKDPSAASPSGGKPSQPGTSAGMQTKYAFKAVTRAYCKACHAGNGVTSSGTYAQWGTVAANTAALPYGTKLYIPGYGYGVIEDTSTSPDAIELYYGNRDTCTCRESWEPRVLTIYVLS